MPESADLSQDTEQLSAAGIPGSVIDSPPDAKSSTEYVFTAAKGSGIISLGKLFEYAGRFVIAFLLARVMGAEQFGLYSLALSAVAIVTTISLIGMDDAVLRNTAIHASQDDEQSLWGTLQLTFGFTLSMSIFLSALLFIFSDSIAIKFFSEPLLSPILRLVAVIVPFMTMSEMLLFTSRGFKRMDYGVIAEDFVQLPVRVVLIGILALFNLNAFTAMVTFGVGDLAASIVLVYFINKEFSLRRAFNDAKRDVRGLLSFSFPFWFSDIINTVRNNIQVMLLGSLSTITSAGIFTIVDRVNLVSIITYRSIETSIRPIIAELQSKDAWQEVGRLYQTSTRWSLLVSIPMTLITILFSDRILLLFGEDFVDGRLALVVLASSEFIKVLTGMSGTIIDMSGLNRLKMINTIIQVVMAVGLNIYLIPRWGLMGAAVSVFIAIAVINLLRMLQVYVVYRLLPFNKKLVKPFTAGFISLLIVTLINQLLHIELNVIALLVGAVLVLTTYLAALLVLKLSPEDQMVADKAIVRVRKLVSKLPVFPKKQFN